MFIRSLHSAFSVTPASDNKRIFPQKVAQSAPGGLAKARKGGIAFSFACFCIKRKTPLNQKQAKLNVSFLGGLNAPPDPPKKLIFRKQSNRVSGAFALCPFPPYSSFLASPPRAFFFLFFPLPPLSPLPLKGRGEAKPRFVV